MVKKLKLYIRSKIVNIVSDAYRAAIKKEGKDKGSVTLSDVNKNIVFLADSLLDIQSVKPKKSLQEVHEAQKKILDFAADFFEENGLQYFLYGGTLLGSVRHEGFIPWDDDIDVGLYEKDLIRLISMGEELKKEGYFVSSPMSSDYTGINWNKLYKKSSGHHISLITFNEVATDKPDDVEAARQLYVQKAKLIRRKYNNNISSIEEVNSEMAKLAKQFKDHCKRQSGSSRYLIKSVYSTNKWHYMKLDKTLPLEDMKFKVNGSERTLYPGPRDPLHYLEIAYGKDYERFPSKIFPLHDLRASDVSSK